NWQIAYATDGSHVFVTLDGGQNWTNITGDLVATEHNAGLHSIEIVKIPAAGLTPAKDVLLVGGRDGVFRTVNPVGDPAAPTLPTAKATIIFPGGNNDIVLTSRIADFNGVRILFTNTGKAVGNETVAWSEDLRAL